ncbi:MAG: tetratricopeptide repeat protein [Acidobacteria bacterium]|nr:tetratricopeptide repeat protein [Acidobacteriota bacterium]
MTVTAFRMALVAGFVATSFSPALAQRRELQQMAADIRILQEQTQLLQNALSGLTDALTVVNQRIDEQTAVTRKTFADAKLQADAAGSDIRVVRERVDDTNVRITSLSQEVQSLRDAIAAMPVPTYSTDLGLPGTGGAPGAPGGAAPGDPAATLPQPAGPNTMSPSRLYDLAWADYTAGNYDLAVEGFSSYVRSFPKSEFADNAQYYIGESFYQRGKLAEAVDAFGRVISTYPTSDVGGQAYYKRGMCYERLNQPDRAREDYDAVIKALGDTDAGRLAKQRLDALSRTRPQ